MVSYCMKILSKGLIAVVFLCFFGSCEEVIELEIDDAPPKIVIEANVSEGGNSFVRLSQTTKLYEDARNRHLEKFAEVWVVRSDGAVIPFIPTSEQGLYVTQNIHHIVSNYTYTLYVHIEGEFYTAEEYMHPYIEVDSTGTGVRRIFNDDIYYASLRFQDPLGVENYYRYDVAINNGDFLFNSVLNDRFNDGLEVVHEILSPEENLSTGDVMRVRRSVISKPVYQYWNDLQSVNPGSVAPANPRSNISNGALGYFSASSSRIYDFTIRQFFPPEPEDPDDED